MGLGEAHQLQPGDHGFRLGSGEFDEFETVHAQRVFLVEFGGGVLHDASPLSILGRLLPPIGAEPNGRPPSGARRR
ncbi:hypothetical protein D3C81_1639390 [compost metagenome]